MKFRIHAERHAEDKKVFIYDNMSNTLSDEDGFVLEFDPTSAPKHYCREEVKPFSRDVPLGKSREIRLLKIQLGLSCNYSCEYCSQRFVERAPETSKKDIDAFMEKLENLEFNEKTGLKIEMWGGEPLVYWKTLRPLTAAIKEKFKDWKTPPRFSIITNGSLFSEEICNWLYDEGFSVGLSHDAMGQPVRGPDPFDEPGKKEIILKFFKRMHPEGRISFNAMLTAGNYSRKAIHEWFINLTGEPTVALGEGGLIDSYDEGGLSQALQLKSEHFAFRRQAFNDIYSTGGDIGFRGVLQRIDDFSTSVLSHDDAKYLGQKCGMDDLHTIAIDLRGNVITCQNVSAVETSMNGESHHAGNIVEMDKVQIKTATHWQNRPDCASCPVVHICKGACMFLEGKHWEVSCSNAFSDTVVLFALAFEKITGGYIPSYIDAAHLPAERRDIWGTLMQHEEKPVRKTISIKVEATKTVIEDVEVFTKTEVQKL